MKTMRKVFALFLTMAMCAAISVSAFAAGPASESGVTTKTYDLGNNISVTVMTAPNEITPMPLAFDRVLDALAAPTSRHTFLLESGEGSTCTAHVWNDATNGTMLETTFSVTINGQTSTLPAEEVAPGKNTNFIVEDHSGNDLVGKTVTTIKALDNDSVRYSYLIEQV